MGRLQIKETDMNISESCEEDLFSVYNHMFICRDFPKKTVKFKKFKKFFRKSDAWFAKYLYDFDCAEETDWWFCLTSNSINLKELSSKQRSQIKKGLANCKVRILEEADVEQMYGVLKKAGAKYSVVKLKQDREEVQNLFNERNKVFGVFVEDGILAGYGVCSEIQGFVKNHILKFDPDHLQKRTSDALIYEMVNFFFERGASFFSDGERSIRHTSQIQKYLEKTFGFRKAYCKMKLVYKWWFLLLIKTAKPFYRVVEKLSKRSSFANNIKAVLTLEEPQYKKKNFEI